MGALKYIFSNGKVVVVGKGFKGNDGKSAYQYAKDGGYTGTEAEFAEKLAKEFPTKLSSFENDEGFITDADVPVKSVNSKTGAVTLNASDVGARPSTWTPTYSDVGAEKSGAASSTVSAHNTNTEAHNDIRLLIEGLITRVNTLLDSDDVTLDQMSELVSYAQANRGLIEQITTGKVSVSDIVNNLTTNVTNKPLSAAQGVALKALIDAITVPTKVSELTNDSKFITASGAPVQSVAGKTGAVTLANGDVGLGNVDNVKQYSASNPPPYPVASVNGQTGAVTLDASAVGALASANYTTKALKVTYEDGTSETVTLVVAK